MATKLHVNCVKPVEHEWYSVMWERNKLTADNHLNVQVDEDGSVEMFKKSISIGPDTNIIVGTDIIGYNNTDLIKLFKHYNYDGGLDCYATIPLKT